HMLMVDDNVRNQFRQNAVHNVGHLVGQNAVQNLGIQIVKNMNGLSVVLEIANQYGNGNVVTARAEGNSNGINGNQIRCYNCRGEGHYASNYTVKPRKRDAAYLQTQLYIAQKDEAGIQLSSEDIDFMATAGAYDEIEKVTTNYNLQDNLQHASKSGTRSDKAPVYDSNRSAELSKEKSNVSSLLEEKKKLKSDFKIREDELLDKQIQLENSFYHTEQKMALGYQNPFYLKQAQRKHQCLYDGKVLLEKHDPPVVHDSEETLQLAQESRQKMKQLNKEIKPANYTKINLLSGIFVSQTAKSQEEVYVVNTSKTATVSKSISKPNEEFLDDTTLSVARKFLNEVKSTIVTLQRVVKHRMTLDTHNWSSSAHQEIHKILKEEIFPIINQVDSRLQNFEIQFLKEAAKFVRDFKSLAKEADESLAKHKTLELEIERLLRAVVSQDIMSIVQNPSVVDSSNLQTELDRTKERLENCIIKKENEYAKLWNDWYKKCEECKYDKISYDKAYNDMQQKIERLQAQLGDQKGKSKDTPCVSNTLDPLSQKLENENVELEFQDTTFRTSENTKFAKQSILGKPPSSSRPKLYDVSPLPKSTALPKVGKSNALSKPVTSNSTPSSCESTVVNNERVIAPGIFRINPFKAFRVDNFVPNKCVKASVRTKPIIVSQPHVITKNDVNSKTNGFSPKDIKSTTRTRRPQPRNNPKSDKIPFKSKSSCLSNKLEKIEENHRSLQSFNYLGHTSSKCNNIKLATRNEKSEVIFASCKQCLITANHDECVL
ncbi:hypothetical protein Tco_0815716, partial [Tanacetum coccineum]